MDLLTPSENLYKAFIEIGIFIVLVLSLCLFFLSLGIYKQYIFLIYLLTIGFFIYFILKNRKIFTLNRIKKDIISFDFLVFLIIFLICLFNGLNYHATLIPTRDYGTYSNCAIAYAKVGSLRMDDVVAYGGFGRAKYNRNNIICGQPPGYSTFLSIFYYLGGLSFMLASNSILFFFSLSFIYLLGRLLLNRLNGFLAVILFSSLYPSFYFPRRTLSENLSLFLVWLGALAFMYGFKKKKWEHVSFSLVPLSYFVLTRSEGVLYFLIFLLAFLLFSIKHRKSIPRRFFLSLGLVTFFLLFLFYYTLNLSPKNQFNIFNAIQSFITGHSILISEGEIVPGVGIEPLGYVWNLLSVYGVIYLICIFFIGIYKKMFTRKAILLIFLTLPTLIFLYKPNIATDHPWSLRRNWPVLFPLLSLLSGQVLSQLYLHKKKIILLFVLLFVCFNLMNSRGIFSFCANRGDFDVQKQGQNFTNRIGDNSLVIMPSNYGNTGGRWCTFMHFQFDLNCIYPLKEHPLNGNEYNSVEDLKEAYRTKSIGIEEIYLAIENGKDYGEEIFIPKQFINGFSDSDLVEELTGSYRFENQIVLKENFFKSEGNFISYPPHEYQSYFKNISLYKRIN